LRRQRSEQYRTWSQQSRHFFRQANGRLQTGQIFVGSSLFFTILFNHEDAESPINESGSFGLLAGTTVYRPARAGSARERWKTNGRERIVPAVDQCYWQIGGV